MKDKILIIGGHGAVGRIIIEKLADYGLKNIIIGGRDESEMQKFIKTDAPHVTYRIIDIHQGIDEKVLQDIKLVVMCVDQLDTRLVSYLVAKGIGYIDITANSEFMLQISNIENQSNASVITSVGLAPGLTNLMVHQYLQTSSEKKVAIDILLGAGDSHGKAAVEWLFKTINQPYQIGTYGEKYKNFSFGRKVTFPPQLNRYMYNFNFSDQFILRKEFPDVDITTYLGFDLNFLTNFLHTMQKRNWLKLLESKTAISILQKVMSKKIMGSDIFAVKVSNGETNDPNMLSLYGYNEREVTAEVAAYIIKKTYTDLEKIGVKTIADVCTLSEIIPHLTSVKELIQHKNPL